MSLNYQTNVVTSTLDKGTPCLMNAVIVKKNIWFHKKAEFHIHGSVHRDSILIRSNKMQQYAGIYLLQNYSTLHFSSVHRIHLQEYRKL